MTSGKKILVTGSNGQLGQELRDLAVLHKEFDTVFLTRQDVSLDDVEALVKIVRQHQPDFVINCAAYTAVDKAESEKEEAFQINAIAVGALAQTAKEIGAYFIHISTDYVFDGVNPTPRKESDLVSPVNVYGESKRAGEETALRYNADSIIIRTSWVYSYYGKNFVKTMMRLMNDKESILVVDDQHGSPTYAADLAEAIWQLILSQTWQPGIYHFSNEGVTTWFDFARQIKQEIASPCDVLPTTSANFPTPAKRPSYSVMDKTKIQQVYGIIVKPWQESLKRCLTKLLADRSET